MTDIIGPADAPNFTTSRPADDRSIGSTDTWMKDCTGPTANDGTKVKAAWLNAVIGQFRSLIRGNGNTGGGPAVVTEDNADDMALRAVQHLIQRGQPSYAVDSGAADALAVSLSPAAPEYQAGMVVRVQKSANANTTTTPTLNVNTLGAKTIINADGSALRVADLPASSFLALGYDGAAFRLLSYLPALTSGKSPFSATYANRFARTGASISVPHSTQTAVPFDSSVIGADANCVLSSGACKILKAGRYIIFSGASINFTGTKPEGTYCAGIFRNGSLQANGSGILSTTAGTLANFEATSFLMADLNVNDLIQVSVYQFNAGLATLTPICSSTLNILRVI